MYQIDHSAAKAFQVDHLRRGDERRMSSQRTPALQPMAETDVFVPGKEAALRALGVVSSKRLRATIGQVEFVRVRGGQQLLTRGSFAPTVLVGVTGAALIASGAGHVTRVEAPFVIDTWIADDRLVAEHTVVAESPSKLLLIDWRSRDAVFSDARALTALSVQTLAACMQESDHVWTAIPALASQR